MGQSLFEKLWQSHEVKVVGDGYSLLYVDRHILNDMVGVGLAGIEQRGLKVAAPDLTFAVPDHLVPTVGQSNSIMPIQVRKLRVDAPKHGIRLYDTGQDGFGIVHVMAPEQGLALPGMTFTCGDSHSSTIGALGALAWGIGLSEVTHILATQTSLQYKPQSMRITVNGTTKPGLTGKDVILRIIQELGVEAGVGYAVEYAGPVIRSLGMDGRFTICNMSVEMGARFGIIAPDDTTFAYLAGREMSPKGKDWEAAVAQWRDLPSDGDAKFDKVIELDLTDLEPQISWGTTVDQVIGVNGRIPDPAQEENPAKRRSMEAALAYMGLSSGAPIQGLPIDWAFIGSCTNSRIQDLRDAAKVIQGRRVAKGVRAWVVPGSERTRLEAEAEHLDEIFKEAGFEWREPSCSMCAAANGDIVPGGERTISSTNRNFEGRQGPGSRTHLASPAMVAAAAIAGCITDLTL